VFRRPGDGGDDSVGTRRWLSDTDRKANPAHVPLAHELRRCARVDPLRR
jgi:hypothetical protein